MASEHPSPAESTQPGTGERSLQLSALQLAVASFTVLFEELTIIRWLPGEVRVLAYFPNLILISVFLGLGVGCLRAGRRSLAWLWPASLLLLLLVGAGLGRVVFTESSTSEHLWLLYYDLPATAPVIRGIRLPILVSFLVSALSFIPLGQLLAERLNEFRRLSSPLWGYCWDILGSLLGVVAFTALSFAGAKPIVWFTVVVVAGATFFVGSRLRFAAYAACAALLLVGVGVTEKADVYSPYYALSARPAEGPGAGFSVLTNGSLHQFAFSAADGDPLSFQGEELARAGYRVPYELLGRPPGRVLVLGAGTGNDVATLLRMGAERVDAVEIDPEILELGRRLHPNRPYSSPRVRTFVTDARSYLNGTTEKYDLVVFGTLDSMTKLSALSSVRLDNFVYTREGLEAARRCLEPDGGLVLYFMVNAEYIDTRLVALLTETFGEEPVVLRKHYWLFNRALLAGPAFAHLSGEARRQRAASVPGSDSVRLDCPSDDWPYLYLARRGISGLYLSLMAAILALSVVTVAVASGEMRTSLRTRREVDWEMLLFGLAFLLLETKAITDMSLVWGATWLTNSVVFGAILVTILVATVAARFRRLPFPLVAVGLSVSLLGAYALPVRLLLSLGVAQRFLLCLAFVGAPVFFAATAFALLFEARPHSDQAFGWNVIGAVIGGLLGLTSMAVGLRAQALMALASYLVAFLIWLRRDAASARPS